MDEPPPPQPPQRPQAPPPPPPLPPLPPLLLSAADARALLVGTGHHPPASKLGEVPAVARTVADLSAALVERAGLAPEAITELIDPGSPGELARAIDRFGQGRPDVLFFYYVGHGLIGPQGKLYLATGETVDLTRGAAAYQALPYQEVHRLLSQSRARLAVVVLDCCHAGLAEAWRGSYLLTATGREEQAWAVPGEEHTAFGGALIRVLRDGDPAAPPVLTVEDVYRCLTRALDGRPRPRRVAADHGARLPFALNAARPREERALPAVASRGDEHCPYPGVRPFGMDEKAFFFGRDELTARLIDRLERRDGVPLLVVGASGAGKSSVLRAGLLNAWGARPYMIMKPGAEPRVPGGVPDGGLLVVDQFEEVFTLCADESRRRGFVAELVRLCDRAHVVLGLRADFFSHCTDLPELVPALRRPEPVTAMTEDQLKDVIAKPALATGLTLEDGLVELLLEDVASAGISLPLLSHALFATWLRSADGVLTLRAYRATGGIAGSLAQAADRVLDSFGEADLATARTILLRLVRLGTSTEDTRRRVPIGELPGRHVLDVLAKARLVIVDEENAELVHDALIRGWPRLRGWIEADRADLTVQHRLADDAAQWDAAGRQAGYLYSAPRLAAVEPVRDRLADETALSATTLAFLRACDRAVARAARIRRTVIGTLAGLTVLSLVAGVIAVVSANTVAAERDNTLSRQFAQTSVDLIRTEPESARWLAAEAWHLAHTPEARHSLFNALAHPIRIALNPGVRTDAAVFSPDGRLVAVGTDAGAVEFWDTRTYEQVGETIKAHDRPVNALAFRPDGRAVVSAGGDGVVRRWSVPVGEPVGDPIDVGTGPIFDVAFGPQVLATAGEDGAVRLWDDRTGAPSGAPFVGGSPVTALAFSGTVLAGGDQNGVLRLWDVAAHKAVGRPLPTKGGAVTDLAFRGRELLSAHADGYLRTWDTLRLRPIGQARPVGAVRFSVDGRSVAMPSEQLIAIRDELWRTSATLPASAHDLLAFDASPDGRTLVTASVDGSALWRVGTHHPRGAPLPGGDQEITATAFSPDGRLLAAAGSVVRLWDTATWQEAGRLTGHASRVTGLAFTADGRRLATVGDDSTVRLWDVSTRRQLGEPFLGHTGSINAVAVSPDQRTLVTVGADDSVRLWSTATHRAAGPGIIGSRESYNDVVFSPDGRRLVVAGGRVRVFDVRTFDLLLTIDARSFPVIRAAFAADGSRLVTAGGDGTARIWSVEESGLVAEGEPLTGHTGPVLSAVFGRSGQVVVTSGSDGTTRVWDVATHRQIGASLTGLPGEAQTVAVDPGETTVVTGDTKGTINRWEVGRPADPFADVCRISRRSVPDGRVDDRRLDMTFREVCPDEATSQPSRSVALVDRGRMLGAAGHAARHAGPRVSQLGRERAGRPVGAGALRRRPLPGLGGRRRALRRDRRTVP